jgi:Protein of unknown function (DUF2799)
MHRGRTFWLLAPMLALAGCAGMSEQQCAVTDWRSVGFEDGAAGRTVSAVGNYRQACSKYGYTPDLDAYRTGHAEGVEVYCRPGRGFEVGRSGQRYQGVCPAESEGEFLDAYADGRHLHELESALYAVNGQINGKQGRIAQLKKNIAAGSAQIVASETPAEDRARLLVEIADMAKEQGELEKEIVALESDRVLREQDLAAYQQTLAYGY